MSFNQSMTAAEVFEIVSEGGANDFLEAMKICRRHDAFCLIGRLVVNCYVPPVYTMDADFIFVRAGLARAVEDLRDVGFVVETYAHSINVHKPGSQLLPQFPTNPRYQPFLENASVKNGLGCEVPVASLENIVLGKTSVWSDSARRFSKRKKDELDLIRIGEKFPALRKLLPREIAVQLESAE